MREGTFLNISFQPQFINPPNKLSQLIDISKGNIFLKSFE